MIKHISFFIGSMKGGGAERVISILANHYREKEWKVDIVLLLDCNVGYELNDGIRIIDLSQSKGSYYKRLPKWLWRIRKYVKNNRPDLIISFVGRINVLVLTACLGIKVPIIVSERNDPKHDGRSKTMLKICNICYKKARKVVFQTEYEKSCFSSKMKNSVIIPNPVSVKLEPKNTDRPFEIVTAGRLLPQKNQKMLIEAISKIQEYNISLKIYGDGELKEDLKEYANSLNVNAEFCGNVSDLHERINGAGIFVLCSDYEGLSNALIEAMMLGIPCISTDYPGADEIIVDGENGLLVPCGDSDSLASAIKYIFSEEQLRLKLSTNAILFSKKFRENDILTLWEKELDI